MSERMIGRMLAPVRRRLDAMVARAVVTAVTSSKMQSLQVKLMADEVKDGAEHFEPYGFTSHPKAGAEGVAVFPGGDRSHGIVVVVADRRYRLATLAEGEVTLHDDQGQRVHLTRAGIVIDGAGKPVTVTGATKVRMETALLEVTGEIKDLCESTGRTMSDMRATYNAHVHPENDSGGPTSAPTTSM